jgi:hypothetical protein
MPLTQGKRRRNGCGDQPRMQQQMPLSQTTAQKEKKTQGTVTTPHSFFDPLPNLKVALQNAATCVNPPFFFALTTSSATVASLLGSGGSGRRSGSLPPVAVLGRGNKLSRLSWPVFGRSLSLPGDALSMSKDPAATPVFGLGLSARGVLICCNGDSARFVLAEESVLACCSCGGGAAASMGV